MLLLTGNVRDVEEGCKATRAWRATDDKYVGAKTMVVPMSMRRPGSLPSHQTAWQACCHKHTDCWSKNDDSEADADDVDEE
jgi:hypothetical protein